MVQHSNKPLVLKKQHPVQIVCVLNIVYTYKIKEKHIFYPVWEMKMNLQSPPQRNVVGKAECCFKL